MILRDFSTLPNVTIWQQREACSWGGPIYAMKHGPILGKPFQLIKGCDVRRSDEWARHIRILPKTRRVRLIRFPKNFRLWYEQRIHLYGAAELYCGDKKTDLEKRVRTFPEWKIHKPVKTENRRIIPWEEILKVRDREDLLEMANRCFEVRQMVDEVFHKYRQKGNIK